MLAVWIDRDIVRARDCPRSYAQAVPTSCGLHCAGGACTVQAVKMFGSMQADRLLSNRFTFNLEKERECEREREQG
jgi:hypothetical protein